MVSAGRSGHDQSMTLNVLIVDDSELICTSLAGLLEPVQGIAIHTAATLAAAMESVRGILPTLLILDLHLPDCNAIQSIRILKQLAPGMKIAMFTNDVNEFNRKKSQEAGANWFFDKSIEFENLLDVVRKQAALNSTIPTKKSNTNE
jgi:DNA-binding NarL/FixJ family response regulator